MAPNCIACGMPMETREQYAGGDTRNAYCIHCARPDGSMQSYAEKLANYSGWLISTQSIDPVVTREQAATILGRLPAWASVRS